MTPLEADKMFAALDRHRVRYVLIGGLAAVLHGSPLTTLDVDICPARARDDLERLAAALTDLDARIRTPDLATGVAFPREADFLAKIEVLNLTTAYGDLDLSFQPAGTEGFEALRRRAVEMTLGELTIPVAALEDVIRSKAAADRPKDRRALPVLRQLLEEIQSRRGSGE